MALADMPVLVWRRGAWRVAGTTALLMAAQGGHAPTVHLLLHCGASKDCARASAPPPPPLLSFTHACMCHVGTLHAWMGACEALFIATRVA